MHKIENTKPLRFIQRTHTKEPDISSDFCSPKILLKMGEAFLLLLYSFIYIIKFTIERDRMRWERRQREKKSRSRITHARKKICGQSNQQFFFWVFLHVWFYFISNIKYQISTIFRRRILLIRAAERSEIIIIAIWMSFLGTIFTRAIFEWPRVSTEQLFV